MSRTHKDVPTKHRKPKQTYDWLYGVEQIPYLRDNTYSRVWYRDVAGAKAKRRKEADCEYHWMSTPSWWTRLTMNRPQRRFYHLLEHKALESDLEEFDFPDLKKKPHIYYW